MTERFAKIVVRAAGMGNLSGADFRTYIAISSHANSDGLAWPAFATIAAETGILRGDIPRSIRRLEAAQLIRRKGRRGDTGANIYRVIFEGSTSGNGVSNAAVSEFAVSEFAVSEVAAGVSADLLQSVSNAADQTEYNRSKNRKAVRKRTPPYAVTTVADVQFEELWRKIPKRERDPKKPARLQFFAALKRGADPKLIIAAAENYAAEEARRGTSRQYIVKVEKWLKEERWEQYGAPQEPEPLRAGMI